MSKEVVQYTLNELVNLSMEVKRALIENFGETNEELEKAIAVLENRFPDKSDSYKFVTDDLRNEAELWKKRAQDFMAVAKRFEAHADHMENRLKEACLKLGVKELHGRDYKWQLQQAKPKVVIDDETQIPSGHKEIVQVTKIRKDGILSDLIMGIPVPGAHLEKSEYVRCYMNVKKEVKDAVGNLQKTVPPKKILEQSSKE